MYHVPRMMLVAALVATLCGCPPPEPETYQPVRPPQFVEAFDAEWSIIEVLETADEKVAWQTSVDIVAIKFDIETMDQNAGYVRSGWRVGYGFTPGDPEASFYRARVILKFEPGYKRLRVKSEAEWRGVRGWDRKLVSDVFSDLQGRIGRVVR